jgi:hypothetical protein
MRTERIEEDDFLAVAAALRTETNNHVLEVCAVLNRLPNSIGGHDREFIDEVDSMMDDLFRTRRLMCPGHRWLNEPVPSIRTHLTALFDKGHIRRDPISGAWTMKDVTSYFVIV